MLQRHLAGDGVESDQVERAPAEIAASLEELRAVARGLHPAVLSGHGLEVALQSVVALAPVPVQLSVTLEDRLPEQIEVAAYYVVSESLTNIGKHARAASVSVTVSRVRDLVVVEVADDGVGGADISARTRVPPPAGPQTRSRPPCVYTRSARSRRPEPPSLRPPRDTTRLPSTCCSA